MKKYLYMGLIFLMMLFMTSCQSVQQAIDDTFATQPEKLNKDQDEDKFFLESIKNIFLDPSNETVFSMDILEDAQDKMEFEFSTELESSFLQYLSQNEIERYLSKEEITEILEGFNSSNFLLDNDKVKALIDDLKKTVGMDNLYIYNGWVNVYNTKFYINLIDPNNTQNVDNYYYNMSLGQWHISPVKLTDAIPPLDNSVHISDFPFEIYKTIVEKSKEKLKEMGDFNEYDFTSSTQGLTIIGSRIYQGKLVFTARLVGSRNDYELTFDKNGNLLEKERR